MLPTTLRKKEATRQELFHVKKCNFLFALYVMLFLSWLASKAPFEAYYGSRQ
jgi:hypothetical protein